jgi:hypothetical protein
VTPTPAPKVLEEGEDYVVYAKEPGAEPQWPDPAAEVLEEGDNYVVYAKRDTSAYQTLTYRVEGYIPEQLNHADEIQNLIDLYAWGYSLRYMVYAIAAVSLLLGVLLFVFLCAAAGHRDAGDTITPNFVDKIPFDLFTAVIFTGIGLTIAVLYNVLSFSGAEIIPGALMILAAGLLFLLWCLSLATRIKLGSTLKSCLCYRLLSWCCRQLRRLGTGAAQLVRGLPLIRRWALILAAVLLGEFFLLSLFNVDGEAIFLWLLEHIVLTALALYLLLSFRRLRLGAKAIAGGDERCEVDTRYLVGELKDHANDLNHIRDGLSAAVAERMKSERFRTELITNVSHDIKTPLTSIVNYVDLLEKEEPESEKVREYVEVLSRQSARLKS